MIDKPSLSIEDYEICNKLKSIPNEYIQLRSNNVPWKQVYCCQFCFDIKSALSEINECRKRGQRSHMKRMSNQTNEMIIKAKRESDSIINAAQGEAYI